MLRQRYNVSLRHQGYFRKLRHIDSPAGGYNSGLQFSNVQAVVRPDESNVEGMFLFLTNEMTVKLRMPKRSYSEFDWKLK